MTNNGTLDLSKELDWVLMMGDKNTKRNYESREYLSEKEMSSNY